jgi:cytidylate kinase
MTVIVAIDGPSGVGKSTTSKAVARALGIPHIDTGAMYRALALKAVRAGIPFTDVDALSSLAAETAIDLVPSADGAPRVLLDSEDVSEAIRQPEISMAASTVSAVPAVRRVLVTLQQKMGRRRGGVLEGRDIGTKVFPETPFKFFLTASPDVRAERRHRDLLGRGMEASRESVHEEMRQRDQQDSTRTDSPLRWDDTYTVIDTSAMTIDEVVDRIVSAVRSRRGTAS